MAVYRREGVPALCLDLQDRRGADVNILLVAAWAGAACGVRLAAADLARLDAAVAPWRDEVVRPLRAVRRRVKGEDEGLYARLKATELEAERIQQDRLHALSRLTPGTPGGRDLVLANLRLALPPEGPADEAALSALADACAGG
nr:TIGR02444 family protein [Azospirillum oleiclasticum]